MANSRPCFLYFIQSGSYIKIGIAADVRNRYLGILTGNPHEVIVLASKRYDSKTLALKAEKEHHRKFSANRHRCEWFRCSDDLLSYIESVKLEEAEIDRARKERAAAEKRQNTLLKLSTVAARVRLPVRLVQTHVQKGLLPVRRIGPFKRPRVTQEEFEKYARIIASDS